jgi:hypothetical protein
MLLSNHITMPSYRGCLKMPTGASPKDHARAKRSFLQSMERWAVSRGVIFKIHAILHVKPESAHWDVVAYSDSPRTPLKEAVSTKWKRASGGGHQSLMPMTAEEIKVACRYAAKDVDPTPKNRRSYLPVGRKAGGMNMTWCSRGFWAGCKVADLWREQIEEWKAAGYFDKPCPIQDTKLRSQNDHQDAHQDGQSDLEKGGGSERSFVSCIGGGHDDLSPDQVAVLVEIDRRLAALPRRAAANIRHLLPTSPDDAVLVERLATISGQMVHDVEQALRSEFGIVETMRARGRHVDPVYHRPPPSPSRFL